MSAAEIAPAGTWVSAAGAATARSFVNVEVETDHVISWITLWGKPFGLG